MLRRRMRRYTSGISIVLVLTMLSYSTAWASEGPEQIINYPVFTKGLASQTTPQGILRHLSQKDPGGLSHTESLDLIIALTWAENFSRAISIAEARREMARKDIEKASFSALMGTVYFLRAQNAQSEADGISWWQRQTSKAARNRLTQLLADKSRDMGSALIAFRDSCRLNPDNMDVVKTRYVLANMVGDDAEKQAAEHLFQQSFPDAAGKEVMEPITGIIIIVAIVATSWVIAGGLTPKNQRGKWVETAPAVTGMAAGAVIAIRVIAASK